MSESTLDGSYIKGRRLTNVEAVAMMFPDVPTLLEDEINGVVEAFNAIPLINPVPIGEIKKVDYSNLDCNLDDDSGKNDCWNCSKFIFPIGCMVGEEVDEGGKTNQ